MSEERWLRVDDIQNFINMDYWEGVRELTERLPELVWVTDNTDLGRAASDGRLIVRRLP